MLCSLRHQPGLNRRSRRSVAVVAWLCFLLFALPCAAASSAACCPDTASGTGPTYSDMGHAGHGSHVPLGDAGDPHGVNDGHGHPDSAPADDHATPSTMASHDCMAAADCCDAPLPTLEDRAPKPPHKPTGMLADLALDTGRATAVNAARIVRAATGPPRQERHAPPQHLELCRFLI